MLARAAGLDLYTRKLISYEEAMGHATEPDGWIKA